ncbi:multidrug transporter [Aquimarina sp. 2201CG5-10]|uniref:multidrug transporter n=1 Tax=Aquimarina callyspongiae TaxID=3098150 RepID=UPI002AB5DBA1|nr:multidrug transporter [Aquimarina sp. 2201CG5-10]MDY8134968.1 multidrug transporter [Aquimarina sp. 2201CG5-10]
MKTRNLFTGILLGIAVVFNACTIQEDNIGDVIINQGGNGNTNGTVLLEGQITENITLTSNEVYELRGGVSVVDGVTMTIEAGTRIIAGDVGGVFSYLAIEQGATILAEGTASQPIVFTSNKSTPNPGDWGGLLLAGRAPINRGTTATTEVANLTYGGTDANDNSGILRYVRLEYTGGKINDDAEYNGLSLYGIGNGTTIEYIQAFNGNDDGIEFFGGTVNVKYAVVTGAGDDSFDWTDGWVGNGQFWIAQQTSAAGDKGIEADNLSSTPDAAPFSNPTLSNITLIGAEDGDGENKGIEFRAGTKVTMYNTIIKSFPGKGIEVDDDQTLANLNSNEVIVRNSIIDNVNSFDLDHDGTATVDLADFATFNNFTLDGAGAPFNSAGTAIPVDFQINGFRGTYQYTAAVDGVDNFDPSTLDSFFDAANYVGALQDGDTWTSGWTRL